MKKIIDVALLPTKQPTELFGKVFFLNDILVRTNDYNLIGKSTALYFTSDETIKDGDWHLNIITNKISNYNIGLLNPNRSNYKKIIATTDELEIPYKFGKWSILPQPTKEFVYLFISEYNQGDVIKEVDVKYELNNKNFDDVIEKVWNDDYSILTNSDNTIDFKLIKNNWTTEELTPIIDLLKEIAYDEFDRVSPGIKEKALVQLKNFI